MSFTAWYLIAAWVFLAVLYGWLLYKTCEQEMKGDNDGDSQDS